MDTSRPGLLRHLADALEEIEALQTENAALRAELEEIKCKVPTEEKRWFSPEEAAKIIGRSKAFLAKDRITEAPQIPFRKDSTRVILYHLADLEAYIEQRKSRRKVKIGL